MRPETPVLPQVSSLGFFCYGSYFYPILSLFPHYLDSWNKPSLGHPTVTSVNPVVPLWPLLWSLVKWEKSREPEHYQQPHVRDKHHGNIRPHVPPNISALRDGRLAFAPQRFSISLLRYLEKLSTSQTTFTLSDHTNTHDNLCWIMTHAISSLWSWENGVELIDRLNVTQLLRTAGNWTRIMMSSSRKIKCWFLQIFLLNSYINTSMIVVWLAMWIWGWGEGWMAKPVYPLLNTKTFNMKTHAFYFICHFSCKNSAHIFF